MHAWLVGLLTLHLFISPPFFSFSLSITYIKFIIPIHCCYSLYKYIGSFWLNPPLPMDEEGNWVGETRPRGGGSGASNLADVDVDPF